MWMMDTPALMTWGYLAPNGVQSSQVHDNELLRSPHIRFLDFSHIANNLGILRNSHCEK